DFKSGICNLLIATSVAARGLDVKELNLVINFDCPNHYEDYIHRVGRTGRAGRKGTAFTFITPDQEKYAPDLVKALKLSNTPVSDELQKLADEFKEQVKKGNAEFSGRGFGGKGLERMDQEREQMKRTQILAYGEEGDDSDEEMVEMDGDVKVVSRTTGQVVDYSNKLI
ncbi:P-loop containing nucleoside triphosphate hydrolase protein, partial [Rozella allomycis CSF55]